MDALITIDDSVAITFIILKVIDLVVGIGVAKEEEQQGLILPRTVRLVIPYNNFDPYLEIQEFQSFSFVLLELLLSLYLPAIFSICSYCSIEKGFSLRYAAPVW